MRGRRPLALAIAVLCCTALLGGCHSRGGKAHTGGGSTPGTPPASAPAAPGPTSLPPAEDAGGKEERQPASFAAQETGPYLDMEVTAVASSGQTVYTLRFREQQPVNFIALPEGLFAAQAQVECGGRTLYRRDADSDSRLLRFDTVEASELSLTLLSPQGTGEPRAGLLPGSIACGAYLPVFADPEALAEYASSFARLTRVTVIGGLCWEENGRLAVDGQYPVLLKKLRALREQYGFSISSTLYPAAALIREGRAGEATRENLEPLIDAILAHAEEYALDGIDLDWETPVGEEWSVCSQLMERLGAALHEKGYALSAALYPESLTKPTPAARAALDTLHLMSYDQFDAEGRHATFSGLAEQIGQALKAGFSLKQIVPGIPAYGRPLDGAARWPLYREQPLPLPGALTDAGYFNTPQLARDKAAYCALQGLEGVFFYHLLADLPADKPLSLMGSID